MRKPFPFWGNGQQKIKRTLKKIQEIRMYHGTLVSMIVLMMIISAEGIWGDSEMQYAQASTVVLAPKSVQSPMLARDADIFSKIQTSQRNDLAAVIASKTEDVKKDADSGGGNTEENSDLKNTIYELVGETPIREMVPYIAVKDKKVAGMLVGIAKKESSFGNASPSKEGKSCYNYWGYKGTGKRGASMGYSCFESPKEAVETVGGRIEQLMKKNVDTPSQMIVWKCGSSCSGHDPASVRKWISDVSIYFEKIVQS